jgi:hypothetical protein
VLQQLQVELQQQRTEQLTAIAAAAGTAQQLGAGSSMQGFCSPPAATSVKGTGSCGRKRKDGAAAGGGGAPGLSSAAKAAGMAHTTPQQQLRQQQMAQLLGVAPASSVSFDLDMYDVDGDEHQQQEQQQQQQEPSQQPAHSFEAGTAGLTPPAAAAGPAAGGAEQPRQQERQQQQQRVPSRQPDAAPANADAMAAQQQQQACLSNSFSSKLIPALQQVQVGNLPIFHMLCGLLTCLVIPPFCHSLEVWLCGMFECGACVHALTSFLCYSVYLSADYHPQAVPAALEHLPACNTAAAAATALSATGPQQHTCSSSNSSRRQQQGIRQQQQQH